MKAVIGKHYDYDFIGVLGIVLTAVSSWVNSMEALSWLETIGKIIGILGGITLMVVSIRHKTMQIDNEKITKSLNKMKKQEQDALNAIKKIIKDNIEDHD